MNVCPGTSFFACFLPMFLLLFSQLLTFTIDTRRGWRWGCQDNRCPSIPLPSSLISATTWTSVHCALAELWQKYGRNMVVTQWCKCMLHKHTQINSSVTSRKVRGNFDVFPSVVSGKLLSLLLWLCMDVCQPRLTFNSECLLLLSQ